MSAGSSPHVLVVGAGGQLGQALCRNGTGTALRIEGLDRAALDVTDRDAVHRLVAARRPALIVNAAAFTAVDRAEHEREAAFALNAAAPAHLAEAAAATGAGLIHISTDSVFDGVKPIPYVEDDVPAPLSVYGASKRAGEAAVERSAARAVTIRTSWLIGDGPRNFLSVILDAAARGEPLRVTAVQHGTPTGVDDLAEAVLTVAGRLIRDPAAPTGTFHYAGLGEATRYDLAVEIMAAAARTTGRPWPTVSPVHSDASDAARRPVNARLDSAAIRAAYGVTARDWRTMVGEAVARRLNGAGR